MPLGSFDQSTVFLMASPQIDLHQCLGAGTPLGGMAPGSKLRERIGATAIALTCPNYVYGMHSLQTFVTVL